MPSPALTQAHIAAQAHLRRIVAAAIVGIWARLGHYDQQDVDPFLADALPVVLAGQQQSLALTAAFLARSLKISPFGINPALVTGAAVRNGTPPADVYRRPFVDVWSSLKRGEPWSQAVENGRSRAESAAVTDVQLSSRATFQAAQDDPAVGGGIYGYQRHADGGACEFCLAVNGAYVKSADASPLHPHCGCSLSPLTSAHPRAAFLPDGSHVTDKYAINEHGELGAVLGAPDQHFENEAAALG
jgi:hypothetical protein